MDKNESLEENKIENEMEVKEPQTTESEMETKEPEATKSSMEKEAFGGGQKEEKKPTKKNMLVIIAVILVAALIGAAVYYANKTAKGTTGVGLEKSGDVIAMVNGEDIFMSEYDYLYQKLLPQIEQSGLSDNAEYLKGVKDQVISGLINDRLLMQYAEKSGITATQEEIDQELALIMEKIGGEESLNTQMQKEGLTMQKLKEDMRKQIIINKYLLANIELNSFSASEEEIQSFYDQASAGQDDVPALEEVSSQISAKIVQDKQQQAVNDFLAALRESSDIKIVF